MLTPVAHQDPSKVAKDISALVLTLSNALIKSVLTKPEILAAALTEPGRRKRKAEQGDDECHRCNQVLLRSGR